MDDQEPLRRRLEELRQDPDREVRRDLGHERGLERHGGGGVRAAVAVQRGDERAFEVRARQRAPRRSRPKCCSTACSLSSMSDGESGDETSMAALA
jgi:hypothetical protein